MAGRSKRVRRRPVAPRPAPSKVPDAVAAPAAAGPGTQLRRSDLLAAGAATLAGALLYVTTFSTHVALGDAPESVSGVKTLGVLHAPGYPSYVAAAAAFAKVVAVGGLAARVNAFSLVCAALMIGAVYLLARSFGASPRGAALGAFLLATSASFWFNADFAKHYAFSGLLVTGAALACAHWYSGGRPIWLVVAGALLGVCAGASWELAAIMAVGLAMLVVFGTRRAPWPLVAGALASMAILSIGAYAFLMWRASQHPVINWGEVTDLNRLVRQISQRDLSGGVVPGSVGRPVTKLPTRGPTLLATVARDIGLGGFAVVLAGAVFGMRSLDRGRKLFLVGVVGLNLLAVALITGVDNIAGFYTVVIAGGFLLDLLVAVAVVAAVGFEPLVQRGSELAVRVRTPRRYRSGPGYDAGRFRSQVAIALIVIVLAPSILVHYRVASHRQPPYADRFANRVLSQLPSRAVLVVYTTDVTFPLVYRQTVFHDRPDVDLVVITSLQHAWYREQIARTLHSQAPLRSGTSEGRVAALVDRLRATRPVFVDLPAMALYSSLHVRLRGLVGEVVGSGADVSIDRDALAAQLLRDDRADGIAGHPHARFPNVLIAFLYGRAHIELAKQYARAKQVEPATTEIARALDDAPFDTRTALVLRFARQKGEPPADIATAIESI